MTLIRQHAKSEAISTLIWAIILGLTSFFTTYLWEIMRSSGQLDLLEKTLMNAPGPLRALISSSGASLASMDGWIQSYVLGTWIALPTVIFTALFAAGIITREMDRRTMEFVLSLPVSRAQLLLSRWSVMVGSFVIVHLAEFLGVLAGVAAQGQEGHPARYALALFNSLLLYIFLGSLMLLASLYFDDYGQGTGVVLGIGLGLTIFHMGTADSAGALKGLRDALPFSWYKAEPIIMNGDVPWGHLAILIMGTGLLLALSVWAFQRKQIAV